MNLFDISVIGELNIDLLLNNTTLTPVIGKEVLAEEMNLTLGSSSAIFASNISSLGARVQFFGKTGKDLFGEFVVKQLQKSGVDTREILIDTIQKTGATVILNDGQDRAMITYPGAMADFHFNEINPEALFNSRHLHISSVFLQPGIRKDLPKIFRTAKAQGLSTSLDTQWDPTERWDLSLKDILPHVDIFLPNEKELCALTATHSVDEAIDSVKAYIRIMVVKMGEKGSLLISEDEKFHEPAIQHSSFKDAIGAGDSFNAGFIFKYLQGENLRNCQQFGNYTGALSTTASGGTAAFLQKKTNELHAST